MASGAPRLSTPTMSYAPDSDRSAFVAASDAGDLQGIRRGLDAGIDVNCDTGSGWTCLLNAAKHNYKDVAQLAIERGANLDHQTVRRAVLRRARARGPAEGTARARRATAAPR